MSEVTVDAQPVAAESKSNENKPMPFQAKLCIWVALTIIALGFEMLTGITRVLEPIYNNPVMTLAVIGGGASLFAFAWPASKYVLVFHVGLHSLFLALVLYTAYALSIPLADDGEPYVTVWAPIVMEVGVLALWVCGLRHAEGSPNEHSGFLIFLHGALFFVLGFTLMVVSDLESLQRRDDVEAQFAAKHVGVPSTLPEAIEFRGQWFSCSMVGGEADCDSISR